MEKVTAPANVANLEEARRAFYEELDRKPWGQHVRDLVSKAPDLSEGQIERIQSIVALDARVSEMEGSQD